MVKNIIEDARRGCHGKSDLDTEEIRTRIRRDGSDG